MLLEDLPENHGIRPIPTLPMFRIVKDYYKNLKGWRSTKKYVLISADDYGNSRMHSYQAKAHLIEQGFLSSKNRFDHFDTLETRTDLEALFEVLQSVKDCRGNNAIFSPYVLTRNMDFEAMAEDQYQTYKSELITESFAKRASEMPQAYEGTWSYWQEGLKKGLLKPEFHGREHFNGQAFQLALKKDKQMLNILSSKSHVTTPFYQSLKYNWTAAFAFETLEDTRDFEGIIKEGLSDFKHLFRKSATSFTPPAQQFPLHLESRLKDCGLQAIDRPYAMRRHLGYQKFRAERHHLGEQNEGLIELVRNVPFEPTADANRPSVSNAMKQIQAAFFLGKPAHISTHRVNFAGHIDESNRQAGLAALRELLKQITLKWPDVEFIGAGDLVTKIKAED